MSIADDIANPFGGIWPEPAETQLGKFVASSTRYLRRIQEANFIVARPPLEFNLIRSGSFNAFAATRKEADFIGMNIGVCLILNNLFLRMMAHPGVLPKVGNSSSEMAPAVSNGVPLDVGINKPPFFGVERVVPNDPVRADYALKLAFIARIFIIEHELCHILTGTWIGSTIAIDRTRSARLAHH